MSLWCCVAPARTFDPRKARRAEVPGNVDGIQTAELAWYAAHGRYLSAPAAPRPVLGVGKDSVDWVSAPEWTTLGWRPDGKVRGAYWIVLTPTGFEVHGTCDIDGDGIRAEYLATESQNALIVTPPAIF